VNGDFPSRKNSKSFPFDHIFSEPAFPNVENAWTLPFNAPTENAL
jgi:hypothetical protein